MTNLVFGSFISSRYVFLKNS